MDWNHFFARLCLFLFACHHQALAGYSWSKKILGDIDDRPYYSLGADSMEESSSSTQSAFLLTVVHWSGLSKE
jgi:hypothetical protein